MNLSEDIGIGRQGGEATVDLTSRPDLRDVRASIVNDLVLTAHPDDRFGAVLLVLDELVGNAYRHSTAPRLLRAAADRPAVIGLGRAHRRTRQDRLGAGPTHIHPTGLDQL
ncbi:hypothetical protein [Amycolatopsis kentuckyensis]|uniref:hypothetical protein n=1 Tax=Amycolatopsis kentuckyensis TaxID=218823 RepID=UPI00142E47F6|nr:hypothetical protein [Amycolatopsis kentuckyensis]